jgi:hypothetical protein
MKRLTFLAAAMMFVLGFSSCLKDTPYMDVSNTQPIIEFGQSAANGVYNQVNGYSGAIYFEGDTVNGPVSTYDTGIALILASPQPLNDTIQVTLSIDPTQIAAWNSAAGDTLTLMPDSVYSMPQMTINILPQHRVASIPVTIPVATFDNGPHAWGLPLTIVNAVDLNNPNTLIIVSGNSGKFMWIFDGYNPN